MTVMANFNRKSVRRLVVMLMALTLFMSACGRSGSTDEASEPVAQPGEANGSQTDPTPLPIPTTTDTTTVPTPTDTEAPTPAPTPTGTDNPAPVPPKPAPTTPAPAAPVSQPPAVSIGCTISPQRTVRTGEYLTFTAVQSPTNASVNYTFDHGDGTLDHTSVSKAYYEAPGVYAVKLRWSHAGGSGTVACGNVTVERAPATPTPTPSNPDCYLGHGAADEPVWWCGGKICVADAPHTGCPRPPAQTPTVSIACTISPQRTVRPGERITFTAVQSPANASVNYTFDHGDGTLDHTSVSKAFYEAPGVYQVKLRWSHAGTSGTILCGSVTVDGFVPTTPPVFNANDYIGKSRTQAEAAATQKGFVSRVIRIDTETFPGTYDYRTDRVNLSIDYGVVTGATVG